MKHSRMRLSLWQPGSQCNCTVPINSLNLTSLHELLVQNVWENWKCAFYFHSCISVTKLTNKTNHYWQDYSINWSNLNASTWRCSDVDSNCIRLITLALSMCKIPIWKYILLLRIGGAWNVENSINSISVDKEFLCHKAHFFINCLVCIFIKHVQNFIRN